MQQRKSINSRASLVTNRGLMVGIPLVISLLFSGVYSAYHRPAPGRSTSATQSNGAATSAKKVQVVTPPKADKLTAQSTSTSILNSDTAQSSPKSGTQSSNNAADNVQKSVKGSSQQASSESTIKLQTKL